MTQGTLPLGLLLSCLLHGGLAVFLWSLRGGGPELPVEIVEVVAVSEAGGELPPGRALGPQPVDRGAPRALPPEPLAAAAPPAVPSAIPVPSRAPAAPPTPQLASEPAPAVPSLAGSSHDEAKPGSGTPGTKEEMASAGVSSRDVTRPFILPGGGYQVIPAYPEAARLSGIEGTTSLRVRILEDGSIGDVIVARSAGHPALDHAAVDAVRRWSFEPARRGDHPVAVWVNLPMRFRLE